MINGSNSRLIIIAVLILLLSLIGSMSVLLVLHDTIPGIYISAVTTLIGFLCGAFGVNPGIKAIGSGNNTTSSENKP